MSQIVRLTALNHVRKSNRQSTLPTDPQALDRVGANSAKNSNSADGPVGRDGRLAQLQMDFDDEVLRALEGVGEVGCACLLLRIVHQLSYAEIAETLEIPAGTAMSHVHRAREHMRGRLASRGMPNSSPPSGGATL